MSYSERLMKEIEATLEEYLPILLTIVRLYRQSVTLKTADISFQQGWKEAVADETVPLDQLWTGFDAE